MKTDRVEGGKIAERQKGIFPLLPFYLKKSSVLMSFCLSQQNPFVFLSTVS